MYKRQEETYAVADLLLIEEQGNIPYRAVQQLDFQRDMDGKWMMKSAKPVARDGVTSLEEFRILYENDLGLPENTGTASDDAAEQCREILRLSGGSTEVVRRWDVTNDGENDLAEVRHTFDNGEQLSIIMAAGQPQDYTCLLYTSRCV